MRQLFTFILLICIIYSIDTYAQSTISNSDVTQYSPFELSDIKFWGYQIQNVDYPGAMDSLVTSHYDMLVLEPTRTDWSSDTKNFNTADMVTRLKNSFASDGIHRKLVIAYIDIGEAEDWRWYWKWSESWDCNGEPPSDWPDYILTCDPDGWGGNYPVAYWDPLWQDIVIWGENQNSNPYGNYNSIIDEVIKDGFDGIYLDWVEAFENTAVINAAQNDGKDPVDKMISFINDMRTYAIARNPDFLIIQQNASALCVGHPELFSIIDAIAQEEVWYGGDATDNWDDPSGYDFIIEQSQTEEYFYYLDQYLSASVPVFNCEYALNYSDSAYARSYKKGYIPYVTRRSLGKLTTTPPPGILTDVNYNDGNDNLPTEFVLYQNYPNPFGGAIPSGNPSTTIKYSMPTIIGTGQASVERNAVSLKNSEQFGELLYNVTLKVYDILGREVATLVNKHQQPGNYKVTFNANGLPSGVYYYSIKTNDFFKTKKMILIR